MLADLFKPAWKSKAVAKRLKAIAAMDSENQEQQEILIQLANDDDDKVCLAAIQKIDSAPALHEISLKHDIETVRTSAVNKLNELMSESDGLDSPKLKDLIEKNPELKVRIAAHAESSDIRNRALQALSSDQLLEVLSETFYTDTRQQIANTLLEMNTLESARKILRGKDKNAERIVKTKLDEFKLQERQQEENLAKVHELIEEVGYLSSRDDWLPEFMPRCKTHCSRWDSLDFDIPEELKQRYQPARVILDEQYQQRIIVVETQQSQLNSLNELKQLLEEIAERDLQVSIEKFFESHEKLEKNTVLWNSLALTSKPEKSLNDQYQKISASLKSATQLVEQIAPMFPQQEKSKRNEESDSIESSVSTQQLQHNQNIKSLNAALKTLKWPSSYGVLTLETELRQYLTQWKKDQKDEAETYEKQLSAVHKNISSIFHFSKIGNLVRAKQKSVQVEKAFDKFSGKDLADLKARYEEASQDLGDMGDWKSFATEPKYLQLCESMEKLIGSKKHSDELFKEMKALQQEWKELGNSDVSEQHWPRFKEAADSVYEPIAIFFEERRVFRKTNHEKRQVQIEQMRKLLEKTDWEKNPDYKEVESNLRSISSRFTGIKEVDHKLGQKQWTQFTQLKDEVFGKLGLVYDTNIDLKQELITQAEALAQEPAKEENLTALKTLQFKWKQVGVTRRKDDQIAWKEFKKQGDQVFNKIQEIRQGQRDETDQQLNAYRELIKEILNLAKTATELSEADQQFNALQASYAELPELPNQLPVKLIEGIERDYRNACSKFDECHDRIINNNRTAQLDELRRKAELCTQLEALLISTKDESEKQKERKHIEQQWDLKTLEDAELSKRIETRRKVSQTLLDRAEITAERKLMCIKLEIVKDAETPADDKAERMQFQLDQMNKSGLGQQALDKTEQLKIMELDWLCTPGAEPIQQVLLDKRFWKAFNLK